MDTNIIYNEDCMITMGRLPDESIDMVFADPPFNIGKGYKGYKDKRDDYIEWCDSWIKEGFRVLKNTGTFYLMTIDRNLPHILHSMSDQGKFINIIKWKNPSASHNKRAFWMHSQSIAMYSKSEDYIFNTYAETRENLYSWDKKRQGRHKGQLHDYWDDIPLVYSGSIVHKEAILMPGTKKKAHLAQMPEMLPGRAIKFSTNTGAIVYDPFMGSGTTAMAALKLGRQFIGSEYSEVYHKLGEDRVSTYLTSTLF